MKVSPQTLIAQLLLIVSNIIFGGNAVISKYALATVSPWVFVWLRTGLSLPWLYVLRRVCEPEVDQRKLPHKQLFLLSLFGVAGAQTTVIIGLSFGSATNGSLIASLSASFTALFAVALRVERFSLRMGSGILVSFVGTAIMLNITNLSFSDNNMIGNLFFLLNVTVYALYLVRQKKIISQVPTISLCFWTMFYGWLTVSTYTSYFIVQTDFIEIGWMGWGAILYAALLASGGAYLMMAFAARSLSPILMSLYMPIQPLTVMILASIFLHEHLTWHQYVGAVFMIVGLVVVATRKPAPLLTNQGGAYTLVELKSVDPDMSTLPHTIQDADISEDSEDSLSEPEQEAVAPAA